MRTTKFLFGIMLLACAMMVTSCKEKEDPVDPFGPVTPDNGNGGGTEQVTDRDGSEAKPYNVQSLIDMKANGTLAEKGKGTTKSWVEGYIVGVYDFDASPQWVIGSGNSITTNVLLADDPASTDTYAVATVKLGSYESVLNLVANPTNLGKKLKLYGVVEKYCGVGGIVNIEKAFLDGTTVELPGADDVDVNSNMKPSEAAAAAATLKAGAVSSQMATVTGYVSGIKTDYNTQYDNISIYMSDNNDAAQTLYVHRLKGGATLQVGDKIAVTGYLTNYKGTSPQINTGATYTVVE